MIQSILEPSWHAALLRSGRWAVTELNHDSLYGVTLLEIAEAHQNSVLTMNPWFLDTRGPPPAPRQPPRPAQPDPYPAIAVYIYTVLNQNV
mmetsp:Transcript_15857/g.40427  ORF Transcript_15857/g.40427 Transcript_15857/m.40427 type:complete len:91 (-) Transcript_15857:42-314(-)